ncbi:hypothetical protein [Streptomyces sp. NBC_00120]|uniref:Integral membrane protein n=1 Tax=Streptomyces sp. NBC_00119 TaxID=2975659 RepID=A0AAU1TXP2_9ACTN|nr:hypothetical protein [Streptomyces sp. NBC_00120]MCX5323754.1 hypothetical protein [Streptomyces sp. NBC_00120]
MATTTCEQPSTTLRPSGTAGRLLRAAVTAHTVAAFGQPVFAGVYLTGEIGGLDWHARGADIVFSLGLLQAVAGAAASARMRSVWPTAVSVLIVAAEAGQYMAGLSGLLWVHLPLGVMIIAALAVLSAAVWVRPLPNRAVADRAADAGEPWRDETHV